MSVDEVLVFIDNVLQNVVAHRLLAFAERIALGKQNLDLLLQFHLAGGVEQQKQLFVG